MPIIDGEFWQFYRPNGYKFGIYEHRKVVQEMRLTYGEELQPKLVRDLDVHTEDRFKPENDFFFTVLEYSADFRAYPDLFCLEEDNPDPYSFAAAYDKDKIYQAGNAVADFVNKYGLLWGEKKFEKQYSHEEYVALHIESCLEIEDTILKITEGLTEYELDKLTNYLNENLHINCLMHFKREGLKIFEKSMPLNLYAHMWLNLISFAKGETNYKQCEYSKCNKWFEIPTSKSGNPQRFCSNSHRVMSYREQTK